MCSLKTRQSPQAGRTLLPELLGGQEICPVNNLKLWYSENAGKTTISEEGERISGRRGARGVDIEAALLI